MATIPHVAVSTPQARRPVVRHNQWRGFANLLRNELRRWWGTRRWLVHMLVWIGVLNGLVLLGGAEQAEAPSQEAASVALVATFVQGAAFATESGMVAMEQAASVGERHLGITAPILARPVVHSAFVLARLVTYGLSIVSLAILLPAAVFSGEHQQLAGQRPGLAARVCAAGVAAMHTLSYLALIVMLGALLSWPGPAAGSTLGLLFAGFVLSICLRPRLQREM